MDKMFASKMKEVKWTQLPFLFSLIIFIVATACSTSQENRQETTEQNLSAQTLTKTTVPVEGMSCNACAASIKKKLNAMEGLEEVEVSLEHRNATVYYEEGKITPQQVLDAINELGYKAGEPTIEKNTE